jgi:molybdenum cofactor guanylyltransferase
MVESRPKLKERMLGVVLAGGLSQRFGTDKAGLIIDGEPLWQRQLGVLRDAGAAPTVLMRRPGQGAPVNVTCWRDQITEAGPMGGLHAALARQADAWVAVLAVDMPGIDAAWFRWLLGFCRPGMGAMAQHPEACEPLAAIYPAEALGEIDRRMAMRDYSLQRLAFALAEEGRMTLVAPAVGESWRVRSVNTVEHYEAWRERLIPPVEDLALLRNWRRRPRG